MSRYIDAEVLCKEHFMCDCLACEDCYKTQKQKIDCEYYSTYSLQDFCGWINETPTADVRENVHGEWIHKDGIYGVVFCSKCDYELRINNTNFCPKCGADMRGVKE